MKIATKLRLALAGSGLAVLGLGLLDYFQSRRLEQALLQLRQFTTAESRSVAGIRESIGVLSYALTSLGETPASWPRAQQISDEAINTIELGFERLQELDARERQAALAEPDPQGKVLEDEVRRTIGEFKENWKEYNDRVAAGLVEQARALRTAMLLPSLSEEVRTALDAYIGHLRLKHNAQVDHISQQSRQALMLKLFSGGLLLMFAGFITVVLHRGVLAPLRQLEHEAGRVVRGEGHFRVDADRADELGSVAVALNGMLDNLQANTVTKAELETRLQERTRELRQREVELQQESERLSLALDALRTTMWDFDITTGRVELDTGWSLMMGGPAEVTKTTIRKLMAKVHPADRPSAVQATRDCINGVTEDYSQEHRVQTVQGDWIWVQSKGIVTAWDKDGRAARMIGTNTDVTARKTAEFAIVREVAFLNALNHTTVALLQRRSKSEILEALAERAAELLESVQVEVALIEGDELVTHAYGGDRRTVTGGRASRSEAVLSWRAIDTLRPVLVGDLASRQEASRVYQQAEFHAVAVFPILHGNRCLGVLAFLRNGTDRPYNTEEQQKATLLAQLAALVIHNAEIYEDALKVAEARTTELRESEAQFRGVFDESPIPIVLFSYPEGKLVEINRATTEVFGYTREEALGRTTADLQIWPTLEERNHYLKRLQAEGELHGVPTKMRTKSGALIDVLYNASRITIAGRPCLLSSVIDVTAQKQTEAALQQSEAHLRQVQKMESLGTLAGGIAHDFNNILTGILGHAQLALGDLTPDHPAHRWMEGILKSGARAKDLVHQILTFSRKTESTRIPTRLQVVAQETLALLRSTLPAMVHIESDVNPACGAALADATQIHQVILNLCTNAWHALPETGGVIRVALAPRLVTEAESKARPGLKPGPHVVLAVRDNGRGMDAATVERIFEPFFTTKGAGKGTGLGLAVVHSIVTAHGGAVFVQSTPGRGTTFEVFLPTIDGKDAATAASPAAPLALGHGEPILVVDDEPASGFVITRLLERLGYKPSYCTDPRQALSLLAARNFALLLTDLAMPAMPGDELARRALERNPNLPVLLVSGFIEPAKLESIRRLGVREILAKPPGYTELAVAVDRCLQATVGT